MPRVGVCAASAGEKQHARVVATELRLPLVARDGAGCDLLVVVAADALELHETGPSAAGGVRVALDDARALAGRCTTASRRQPLARAVGLKRGTPSVMDVTVGLGRDALLLARLGCMVTVVERSPVLRAMWRDALRRAGDSHGADRIRLIVGDAVDVLSGLPDAEAPDVIYVDPMYPPKGKSALPKKEMRILRRLVGDDQDAGALLEAARRVARDRVVVKRTPRAKPLAPSPALRYSGKLVRYDVYLTHAQERGRQTEQA